MDSADKSMIVDRLLLWGWNRPRYLIYVAFVDGDQYKTVITFTWFFNIQIASIELIIGR